MEQKRIFALGFFDGVHIGHQALLKACCDLAGQQGIQAAAVTFDAHPQSLVLGQAPALINSGADRVRLLRRFGIGPVYTLHFNKETMSMPWQEFFRLLVEDFGAAGIVCGDDFRFGYRGEGNAEKLRIACKEKGLPCIVVPEQTLDGIRVSSTHIRGLMENGDLENALRFLGHPHLLSGTVVSGHHLGRTMGVPTANLQLPEGVLCPKFGVYACIAEFDGRRYPAVANVGTRPTVGGHHITVEPWILGFDGDLYGTQLQLWFYKFLRPERKFDSLDQLRQEIGRDAERTMEFFGKENFSVAKF